MMDGWQRRLAGGGDSVRVEELKRGMNLDLSFTSTEDASTQGQAENNISTIPEDEQEEEMSETEAAAPEPESSNPPQTRAKFRKMPERSERALKERSDNAAARPKRLRKVSFTPGLQGSPCEPSVDNEETLPIKAHQSEAGTRRQSRRKTETRTSRQVSNSNAESNMLQMSNDPSLDHWLRLADERWPKARRGRRRSSRC